jgi:hypothetical protein
MILNAKTVFKSDVAIKTARWRQKIIKRWANSDIWVSLAAFYFLSRCRRPRELIELEGTARG